MDKQECPCPSCGFYTKGEFYFGSYNICPICDWEDDGVQLANPGSGGGANRNSLIEYQIIAMKVNPIEIQVTGKFRRDPKWRPLNTDEIIIAEEESNEKRWNHKAIQEYSEVYWNL
jgi:hypothetical protein